MSRKMVDSSEMKAGTFLADNAGLGGESFLADFAEAEMAQSGTTKPGAEPESGGDSLAAGGTGESLATGALAASETRNAAESGVSANSFLHLLLNEMETFLTGGKTGNGFMKTMYDSLTQDTNGLQEEAEQDITPS